MPYASYLPQLPPIPWIDNDGSLTSKWFGSSFSKPVVCDAARASYACATPRGLGAVINSQGIMQSPVVREHAGIADDQVIMKSIALGWPDETFPANAVVSERLHRDSFNAIDAIMSARMRVVVGAVTIVLCTITATLIGLVYRTLWICLPGMSLPRGNDGRSQKHR